MFIVTSTIIIVMSITIKAHLLTYWVIFLLVVDALVPIGL